MIMKFGRNCMQRKLNLIAIHQLEKNNRNISCFILTQSELHTYTIVQFLKEPSRISRRSVSANSTGKYRKTSLQTTNSAGGFWGKNSPANFNRETKKRQLPRIFQHSRPPSTPRRDENFSGNSLAAVRRARATRFPSALNSRKICSRKKGGEKAPVRNVDEISSVCARKSRAFPRETLVQY